MERKEGNLGEEEERETEKQAETKRGCEEKEKMTGTKRQRKGQREGGKVFACLLRSWGFALEATKGF